MAHIHLAWELGGGLGHAARLKALAQALQQRGHHVSLSLRELVQTDTLLASLDAPRFQAPSFSAQVVGLPSPPASLAEILIGCGWLDARAMAGPAAAWRSLLQMLAPDLLVADYAPGALLAARALGLPAVVIGNAFCVPPAGPLPALRAGVAPARLAAAEARVLAAANGLLAAAGAPPIEHASWLMRGEHRLICAWPELDHFARDAEGDGDGWWGPDTQGDDGLAPDWPATGGPRVFAYLKANHPGHAAVLQALDARGCATLCYLPDVAAGKPAPPGSERMRYARAPVNLNAALADTALCVCHAGSGTVAQALLAGVPLLLLPQQQEQNLLANHLHAQGLARNAGPRPDAASLRALIDELLDSPGPRAAARAVAASHAGFDTTAQMVAMVRTLEALLPAR